MKIKKENLKKVKIKDILKPKTVHENEKKLALMQVLNLSMPEILLNKEKILTNKEQKKYRKLEKQINKELPIQYILKESYFYNKKFIVNKNVLIPRPETEVLVEETNKLIKDKFSDKKINILDIGTGSGIIAITLNILNKNSNVIATDISKKALKIAKKNQKIHKTKVKFIKTNLYNKIDEKFDVIISNPPYIPNNSKNIELKVKNNEPQIALYGGKDGLYYYRQIIKDIKTITKENHIIAFEIGENEEQEIEKLLKNNFPKDKIIIKKDFNDFNRYIFSISQIDNNKII